MEHLMSDVAEPTVTIDDADVSILTIRRDVLARMARGMPSREIVQELAPKYDAIINFERIPGAIGIGGELLDGLVWAAIIKIIYASERARVKRLARMSS